MVGKAILVLVQQYWCLLHWYSNIGILEGTARYVGLLLAPAESFGLAEAFFALPAKKVVFFMLFWFILGHCGVQYIGFHKDIYLSFETQECSSDRQ